MPEIKSQPTYYVAFFELAYKSIEEVRAKDPETLASHLARSNELYRKNKLLMAGALSSQPGDMVTTMGLFYSREDAEEHAKSDPFVLKGMVARWYIRDWINILQR
jgi:uncharacterized protein YciI